jgi:pimeloyl-ACP methyl ester carboxylesterase
MKNLTEIKKSFLFLLIILVSAFSSLSFAQVKYFKVQSGQYLTYELQERPSARATLVFLPGINRGLQFETEKKFFSAFTDEGFNVLTITSSLHPRSIAIIPGNESFFAQKKTVTSKDLAKEVEALMKSLRIQRPIAISLSYSASILAELDPAKFSGFIEMVPLTDPLDGDDATKRALRDQQDFMMLNPFLAPSIRFQRDYAYQTYWSAQVDANLKANPSQYGSKPRVDDIKKGYASLARASEAYRLKNVKMAAPRHFILAEGELESRLEVQWGVAVKENQKSQGKSSVVVVADAGHILPSENPVSAARAVELVANSMLNGQGVTGSLKQGEFFPFTPDQKKEMGLK